MNPWWDEGIDDLDVMTWEYDHATSSTHWAWRAWRTLQVNRQSRWNGFLYRQVGMRFDPPKGKPVARNGGNGASAE